MPKSVENYPIKQTTPDDSNATRYIKPFQGRGWSESENPFGYSGRAVWLLPSGGAGIALQAHTSSNSEINFTAADGDGLSLSAAIRKLVFDPHAQELGELVGALRSDGWVWMRIASANWKADEANVLSAPSDNVYCIPEDGTFIANPADLAEIERNGIEGYRCERLSGAALENKRQNWIRLLFEFDTRWDEFDPITANFVGVHPEAFIWPIGLTVEDLLPAIHSLAALSERPFYLNAFRLDAIRFVARQIVSRWDDLMGLLKRGQLVATGIKNCEREQLPAQSWCGKREYIDLQKGNYGNFICSGDESSRFDEFSIAWCDLQLWDSQNDSATAAVTTTDAANPARIGRLLLPRRPRGPDAPKTRAATETLTNLLRKGEITIAELRNPVGKGGRKHQEIADLLGVKSRTTAKTVIKLVLSTPEFANLASTDKQPH
jgi:hypothetical protein